MKRRIAWSDVLVIGLFCVAALFVTFPLWVNPATRAPVLFEGDQALFQWFLARSARVVTHLENPFVTTLMNAPDGVNMMANTAILGLGVPLIPVTLVFGPHVSLVILLTLALAGTAAAWYFVLSRHLVRSTFAAAVGGWFCGFSPAMVSHAAWHPNLTFQVLVPFIVLLVLKLREPDHALRNGLVLGLLVVYQTFISEEVLFLTAFGCGVFLIVYALQSPQDLAKAWRPMLASLSVTAVVAGVLLAYPLWVQFFGPHHYRGLFPSHSALTNDLASITSFATESLAGSGHFVLRPIFGQVSEENTNFGWPLVLVMVPTLILVRRNLTGRALRVTAVVALVFGLGAEVTYRSMRTGISGPWGVLEKLPVLDSALATRFGIVGTVAIGLLLGLATQQVWDYASGRPHPGRWRGLWVLTLAVGLLPVAPTPLDVKDEPPLPRFISDGSWRAYVQDEKTIVPLPFPTQLQSSGMKWAAAANLDFAIPGGYFLFPEEGREGATARFGAPRRPTAQLLFEVATTGRARGFSEVNRRAAHADLRFWRAAIVVLAVNEPRADVLRATVEALLGPAELVEDVWLWDVRDGILTS